MTVYSFFVYKWSEYYKKDTTMVKKSKKPEKYPVYDILALLSGLDSFPNCDLEQVTKDFSKNLGGVPANLLPTVIAQVNDNYPLQNAAWDIRDWLFKNPEPAGLCKKIVWRKITFPRMVRKVLCRYGIPQTLSC